MALDLSFAGNGILVEAMRAAIILLVTVVIAIVFKYIIKGVLHKLVKKTKTNVDDLVVQETTKPVFLLIIFIGLYFSINTFAMASSYVYYVNRAFFVIIILIIAWIITKIFKILIPHWLRVQKRYESTPRLITKIISVVIYLIALVMVLSYFGVEISPIVATLGIGGLAIGLALQETLSNFFAGIHLISDKPIVPGDFIELEDQKYSGYVTDVGWRSTKVKTLPGNIVIIPNSKLASSIIKNYTKEHPQTSVVIKCGVDYGADLDKVEKITIDAAKQVQKKIPGAVKDFQPFIRYNDFGDSNIGFSIILRANTYVDKYLLTHEFFKALKKEYDKKKIEISWPVTKVYLKKGK